MVFTKKYLLNGVNSFLFPHTVPVKKKHCIKGHYLICVFECTNISVSRCTCQLTILIAAPQRNILVESRDMEDEVIYVLLDRSR